MATSRAQLDCVATWLTRPVSTEIQSRHRGRAVWQATRLALASIKKALDGAGVEFIDENGGGAGAATAKGQRNQTEEEVIATVRGYAAPTRLANLNPHRE